MQKCSTTLAFVNGVDSGKIPAHKWRSISSFSDEEELKWKCRAEYGQNFVPGADYRSSQAEFTPQRIEIGLEGGRYEQ